MQSALEQRLGLELQDDAIANLETLGDLRALVEQQPWMSPSSQEISPAAEDHPAPAHPAEHHEAATTEHIYPRWPWSWPIRAIRVAFIELIMRPLIWLFLAPRVVRETAELPRGPVLLIANHLTSIDGALILYALPPDLRRNVAIAMSGQMLLEFRQARNQQSALRNLLAPAAYWLITALFNVFPLPQRRGFRKSFAHAGSAMDRGYSVMIFPEGRRSPDGRLQRFLPGIGLLAQQSRVPIVPIALIGLNEMRSGKARWFRSGQLEIHIGQAIPVEEEADPAQLTATLEQNIRQLQSPASQKPVSR